MTKKTNKTIAANPLTDYLSVKSPVSEKPTVSIEPQLKQRITVHMSIELIDRVKNAVYWEPGLTLTEFAERAFDRELKKWEKEWGEQYPKRKEYQLKGGRPLK